MSWAKLDDGLDEHRKVEQLLEGQTELGMLDGDALQELAALAAIGLWTLGLTNTSRRLTEGRLSKRVLRALAPATHRLLVDRLAEVGLFDVDDDGVRIHDYLDHNPSREDALDQKAKRALAGRLGGQRSGQARRQATAEASASQDGSGGASSKTEPRTRTPLTTSVEGAGAREPDLPSVSYRGRRVESAVVEHAVSLLDTFNDATKRRVGPTKGDGTASADLKQIVGALIAHPDVDVDAWKHAIRNTVANPPRWVEGQLQTGHIFGERAAAHALANTGRAPASPRNGTTQSTDGARGAELLAGALRGDGA